MLTNDIISFEQLGPDYFSVEKVPYLEQWMIRHGSYWYLEREMFLQCKPGGHTNVCASTVEFY